METPNPIPPPIALLDLGRMDIQAVVSDVDGTLTDGGVGWASDGTKFRVFHVHDGMGAVLLRRAGFKIGWLSASLDDGVIRARAEALGVHAVDVGEGDKGERFRTLCAALGVEPARTIYIGDDTNDLPAFSLAALSCCPADARPEVRERAGIVLEANGGRGAFRELADLLLAARGELERQEKDEARAGEAVT